MYIIIYNSTQINMCVSQNYKQIQAFTLWTSQITRFRFNTTSLHSNDEPVYHAGIQVNNSYQV